MEKTAFFSGSFDPFTLVDLEVVTEILKKYEELVICVENTQGNTYTFDCCKRVQMINEAILSLPEHCKIEVIQGKTLTIDSAIAYNANVLIRGIRPACNDLQEETRIAMINEKLAKIRGYDIKTDYIFISDMFLQSISPISVKNIWHNGEYILLASMVPQNVYNEMIIQDIAHKLHSIFVYDYARQTAQTLLWDAYEARGYHNLQHLGDMLNMLQYYNSQKLQDFQPIDCADIILAILWHDFVITPTEDVSAEVASAQALMNFVGCWEDNVRADIDSQEVIEMIKATELGVTAKTEKQKLIADLDKAVLGTSFFPLWERYSQCLRDEYREYDDKSYVEGRIDFLQSLQKMDRIYQTDWFYCKFEETARFNINAQLMHLCNLRSKLS